MYGKRSEKPSVDEHQSAFEDLEGASAEMESDAASGDFAAAVRRAWSSTR